ncbi:hypothetical protein [Nonomuraea sp. NPDC052265]|uniref:hypothetical protein n=1 Tax=Nonomuraea sp. NPDC052265 TaxID=3364374 RepID=UPI0037CA2C8A
MIVIVILTALDLEYQAVRGHLTDPRVHRHTAGTRFEVGRLANGGHRVALGLVGKGNHRSAVIAERAIAEGKKWIAFERQREKVPLAEVSKAVNAIFA